MQLLGFVHSITRSPSCLMVESGVKVTMGHSELQAATHSCADVVFTTHTGVCPDIPAVWPKDEAHNIPFQSHPIAVSTLWSCSVTCKRRVGLIAFQLRNEH